MHADLTIVMGANTMDHDHSARGETPDHNNHVDVSQLKLKLLSSSFPLYSVFGSFEDNAAQE